MDEIILVRPRIEDAPAAARYVADHHAAGDFTLHGSGGLERYPVFADWLLKLKEFENPDTVPEGYVPATTFFGKRKNDGAIVGIIDVRHSLSDYLLNRGGHIGYGVHPGMRRRGYATQMLRQALEHLAALGVSRALVSCDADNIASRKTIERCGGVLEDERTDENGTRYLRLWIDTKDRDKA